MKPRPEPERKVVPLLADGCPGQLTTARGSHLPVRLAQRSGDVILLVLMLRPGDELSAREAGPAVFEYTSATGITRIRGHALLQDRDLVRFDVDEQPDVIQRRDFVRVPVAQQVKLRIGGSSKTIKAFALDISGGGMLLRVPDNAVIDDAIEFELEIGAGQPPVTGSARVVRTPSVDLRGVAFDRLEVKDRERLIRFIFERQRAELALMRERPRGTRSA